MDFAKLEKEQEDLLVCLADQDASIKKYRERLIILEQEVSDIEEEEDDDNDDDDNDHE